MDGRAEEWKRQDGEQKLSRLNIETKEMEKCNRREELEWVKVAQREERGRGEWLGEREEWQ